MVQIATIIPYPSKALVSGISTKVQPRRVPKSPGRGIGPASLIRV